ncbi:MAG: DUF2085 domain-containing protein [Anaerolineales bacterium]|nr:DUF2085 domain-containing protein [Anaerolineales bacterium]
MQPKRQVFQNIVRWLVPVAAILAFAAWMYIAPEGALGKLDAIGYAVCHRIDARSFHIGDRQLPLCARCTGEFYAAGIALIFQGFISGKRSRLPSRGIIAVLVLFFLAFGIDGSNSYLYLLKQTSEGALSQIPNLYIPNNTLRLFTGSGMGIALAAVLFPIVNQTLWREQDDRPALEWKSFGILIGLTIILNLLILTDSLFVLYPIAYLSALGTLSLLVIVFAILWIMIMREDNTFTSARQLILPFASGLTLALLMILSIDLLRLQFTGTWSGFPGLTG